jgi:4,5:9,10-diseco-3-hydroxy-5,9,17-trioxoandrosta-1(10),2-diene-4-oate hydrolase
MPINPLPDLKTTIHRTNAGVDIAVHEAGAGPSVVFVHGSGPGASGVSNFRYNIGSFVAAGFHVLAPDLIGYGRSSKPAGIDYTLDVFADSLLSAIEATGVGRAHWVGNSLGGAVALRIALEQPAFVDQLVLMAPGGIETRETYFAMPGIARMVGDFTSPDFDLAGMRSLVTNLVYDPSVITDALVAERYAVARTQPKDVLARMRVPDLSSRLGELTMPILGFWGIEDGFCPASGAEKFLSACPDARFVSYSRVGHWVMAERADEFNRLTVDFLHCRH